MEWSTILGLAAIVIGPVATYLIQRYRLGGQINDWIGHVSDIGDRAIELKDAVKAAFKKDEDGVVRLTPDEQKEIYQKMDALLNEAGIVDLPDWN